jgi:integrase/recombinase XerD
MTKIQLRYINAFRDRHGKVRHYVRRPGHRAISLPGLPGSPEFMAAYQAALANVKPSAVGGARTRAGSVNELIVAYYSHAAFTEDLAPATQAMRRAILERFRSEYGDGRSQTLQREHIQRLLDKKKPYAARNWLKTLRGLIQFAIRTSRRKDDPTYGIKLRRAGKSSGHLTWTGSEIVQYRAAHPLGTVARLAFELALNVAARRGDVCKLGRQHITKDDRLSWRPSKTRRSTGLMITVPLLPELQAAIAAMPASDALTFLTNDYGKPFASAAAFGNKFADWCEAAGLKPVTCDDGKIRSYRIHGLRKAACCQLADAGCTAAEIMAVSGHSTLAQVQVYIDEVNRERLADAATLKRSQSGTRHEQIYKPKDPRLQTGKGSL